MISVRMIFGVVLLGGTVASGQAAQVAGVWRGHSECTVKDSPCHDETNVYRIDAVKDNPAQLTVTGSKMLDGEEVAMGPPSQWDYDASKQTLTTTLGKGRFRLTVDGDKMEGEITLADGTVYRRIHLMRRSEEVKK